MGELYEDGEGGFAEEISQAETEAALGDVLLAIRAFLLDLHARVSEIEGFLTAMFSAEATVVEAEEGAEPKRPLILLDPDQ